VAVLNLPNAFPLTETTKPAAFVLNLPKAFASRPAKPDLTQEAWPFGVPDWVRRLVRDYTATHGHPDRDSRLAAAQSIVSKLTETVERDLYFFEANAGCGRLSRTLRMPGYKGAEMDRQTRHADEDMCTLLGLVWAGILVLRLKPKGLFIGLHNGLSQIAVDIHWGFWT